MTGSCIADPRRGRLVVLRSVLGLVLRRSRRISLREAESRARGSCRRRAGTYKAEGGFTFTAGTGDAAAAPSSRSRPRSGDPPRTPRRRRARPAAAGRGPGAPTPPPRADPRRGCAAGTRPPSAARPARPLRRDRDRPARRARSPPRRSRLARASAPRRRRRLRAADADLPTTGAAERDPAPARARRAAPRTVAPTARRREGVPDAAASAPATTPPARAALAGWSRLRGRLARSGSAVRAGPARPAGAGRARRGRLGGGRGRRSCRPTSARRRPTSSSRPCAPARASRRPHPDQARALLRDVLADALRTRPRPLRPRPARTTAGPPWCSSSASTAPARPPPPASSPGCSSRAGAHVVLGAADTFRAAAAEQLQTWGERVGATVVRGPEGADPASVAFDAVKQGDEPRAPTSCSSTPPAACTPRPA